MALTPFLAGGFALVLASVHLVAGQLHGYDDVPRSVWLSGAGGVTVAYVFVHLLPEVEAAGRAIRATGGPLMAAFDLHAYLLALSGFVVFYGLERFVTARREGDPEESDGVFWVHVAAFGAYNLLVGYLLFNRDESGPVALSLFGVAMGLHFLVNDHGLRAHHGAVYRSRGRWVLAGTVLVGAGIGALMHISDLLVAYLLSFLAGSIVLNVIKEDLPGQRESRFWPFAGGAAGYTIILLVV